MADLSFHRRYRKFILESQPNREPSTAVKSMAAVMQALNPSVSSVEPPNDLNG
jgi:hypothetical protein